MSDKDKITFFIKSIYDNLKQLLIYAASLFVTGHILFQIVFVVSKLYKFVHNEIPLDYQSPYRIVDIWSTYINAIIQKDKNESGFKGS